MHTHTHIHTYTHTHIHTHAFSRPTYLLFAHIVRTRIQSRRGRRERRCRHGRGCKIYTHTHTHIHKHISTHIYTTHNTQHTNTRTHTYTHTHKHIHTHTHTHTHTHCTHCLSVCLSVCLNHWLAACCVGCVGVRMFDDIICDMNTRPGHVLLLLLLPSLPFSWLILFVAADIVVGTFFAAASAMHKRPESRVTLTVAPFLSPSLSVSLSLSLSHTHTHTAHTICLSD